MEGILFLSKRLCLFVEKFERQVESVEGIRDVLKLVDDYGGILIGGMAVALYVVNRVPTSREIDFLVGDREFMDLYDELLDRGLEVIETGMRTGFDYYTLKLNRFIIDFLVDVGNDWIDKVDYKMFSVFGVRVRVVSPEWLVALKYYAMREKDVADIVKLFRAGVCDMGKLKKVMLSQFGRSGWEEIEIMYDEVVERGLISFADIRRWFEL